MRPAYGLHPAPPHGPQVVPVINRLMETIGWDCVVVSYDWHPQTHCSFFETVVTEKQ